MGYRGTVVLAVLFCCLAGCSEVIELEPRVQYVDAFDGSLQVSVYDTSSSESTINAALNEFDRTMRRLDQMTRSHGPGSLVEELNRSAENTLILNDTLADLIRTGLDLSKRSDGVIDITLGAVRDLYDFGIDFTPPTPDAINDAMNTVDYSRIMIDGNELTKGGSRFTFDSYKIGWALVKGGDILRGYGIKDFLINAGGIIEFDWHHPEVPATIYVRHPRLAGKFYGQFRLNRSSGLATAKDYETLVEVDGVKYHEIISSTTGLPVTATVSVSVISRNALEAQYYANLLFLSGPAAARDMIMADREVEGILIWEKDGRLRHWISPGLADLFTLNREEN